MHNDTHDACGLALAHKSSRRIYHCIQLATINPNWNHAENTFKMANGTDEGDTHAFLSHDHTIETEAINCQKLYSDYNLPPVATVYCLRTISGGNVHAEFSH